MADGSSFPQIPSTVWWGVRALLNKTPRMALSDDILGVELRVQPAAAKQYVAELKRVGILNEDNKATDLAHKWRMSDTYHEAVKIILAQSYGESLQTIAPMSTDRAKAIDWFQRQGLGEGAARNKAATYFLIASPEPGETTGKSPTQSTARPRPTKQIRPSHATRGSGDEERKEAMSSEGTIFPVNLNLQIHISADASVEQIDAIFGSMRKHLGNVRLS